MRFLCATIVLGLSAGTVALADRPPPPVQLTCPVGGEVFTYSRRSGEPIGYPAASHLLDDGWIHFLPDPIPACPGNGLPIYRDFGDRQADVEAFIGSPAFAEVRARGPLFSVFWIETQVYGESVASLDLLIALGELGPMSETTPDTYENNRVRYLEAIIAAIDRQVETFQAPQRWRYMALAANAERELGRFDSALVRLRAVRAEGLTGFRVDCSQPRQNTEWPAPSNWACSTSESYRDGDRMTALKRFVRGIEIAARARDDSPYVLEAVPIGVADYYCRFQRGLDIEHFNHTAVAEAQMILAELDPRNHCDSFELFIEGYSRQLPLTLIIGFGVVMLFSSVFVALYAAKRAFSDWRR